MKENTENNNRRLKVYWGVREWLHSMYPTYLKWLILPLILIMLIGLDKQTDETIVNTITSVYAGILSSVIVCTFWMRSSTRWFARFSPA